MTLIYKCPGCGASNPEVPGARFANCHYCGRLFFFKDAQVLGRIVRLRG